MHYQFTIGILLRYVWHLLYFRQHCCSMTMHGSFFLLYSNSHCCHHLRWCCLIQFLVPNHTCDPCTNFDRHVFAVTNVLMRNPENHSRFESNCYYYYCCYYSWRFESRLMFGIGAMGTGVRVRVVLLYTS